MYIPTLEGTIDRRLLVNYRVDPAYLQRLLGIVNLTIIAELFLLNFI
jgi:hypothetical protein